MWQADERPRVRPAQTHGPEWAGRARNTRGTRRPESNTVRGGRKARGQFPQIRAAGLTHMPRGERNGSHGEFPQGGDDKSPSGIPRASVIGGRGAVRVNLDEARHRCEVRFWIARRAEKGKEWLREVLTAIRKRRGDAAVQLLIDDISQQWARGNRGSRGDWRDK